MSTWYYSDTQRNRLGPVRAEDLAQLHGEGQLQPGTLVWREGMTDWRPWREVMGEVLGASTGDRPVFATPAMEPALAAASGYNPYEVVERPSTSLYAPPLANVASHGQVVQGGQIVYARFLKRFVSNGVDGLVGGILMYAVLIPLMLVMGGSVGTLFDRGAVGAGLGVGFILLMYAVQLGVPATYQGAMLASGWQATLGKRLTETKVVRSDGSPIGFWRGFLRNVAFVLITAFSCGLGAVATVIMTIVQERRQGLHDMICDTVVVDRHAFTSSAELQDENLNTATKVVLGLYVLLFVGVFFAAIMLGMFAAQAGR